MKNYKTLYYLNSLGLEPVDYLAGLRYGALKSDLKRCSNYELAYYHCKVLKMPLSTFEKSGLILAIVHNAISEYEDLLKDQEDQKQAQAEKNRAQAEKLETFRKCFRACLWFGLGFLVFALGVVFAGFMLI